MMSDFSALYADNELATISPNDFTKSIQSFRDQNNDSPLELMLELESESNHNYGKSNATDDENEDSFASEKMSPSKNEELRKSLHIATAANKKLTSDMQELRTQCSKKEMDITKAAENTIKARERDFKEERKMFENEKRSFMAEKNNFLIEKEVLTEEIEKLKLLVQPTDDEQTPEEEETDKKTLLNEIVRIKTTSAMQEEEFQRRLLAAENNVTKFQNEVIAMEMLKLAMENRIDLLEDERELEFQKHEEQVTGLLKAAGLYDRSVFDIPTPGQSTPTKSILTDTWVDLFRRQLDDERIKINALKDCLMPFANCLSREDNDGLHQAGIILIPQQTAPLKSIRNSTNLFRFFLPRASDALETVNESAEIQM